MINFESSFRVFQIRTGSFDRFYETCRPKRQTPCCEEMLEERLESETKELLNK